MKKGMHRVVSAQDAFRDGVAYAKLTKALKLDSRFERLGRSLLLSDYHYDVFALASNPSEVGWNIELELHEVDFSYLETFETHPWIDLRVGRKEDRPDEHIVFFPLELFRLFWGFLRLPSDRCLTEGYRFC